MIHPTADIQTTAIGERTRIWQFVVILPKAVIGDDCNICSHCLIENDVILGNRVTVKSGVQLWDGLRVGDDVFIGPNATFANDKFPRSRQHLDNVVATVIEEGASIGAGATILPGIRIGRHAMVGAGAVVTRSVPPNAIVVGNPARIVGYAESGQVGQNTHDKSGSKVDGLPQSRVHGVRLVPLPNVADIRGSLTVGEFERTVPFAARRYFLVFDVPSVETRGEHAHKACHQFLICVRGSVTVLADDGNQREQFVLDRPDVGFYMPPMTWGTQYKYSPDAVLLVFASHYYDASDYIRDYDEFVKLAGAAE
jgi:acetyltransferase-like isoleucine patch superfamily enzyme